MQVTLSDRVRNFVKLTMIIPLSNAVYFENEKKIFENYYLKKKKETCLENCLYEKLDSEKIYNLLYKKIRFTKKVFSKKKEIAKKFLTNSLVEKIFLN